MSNEVKQNTVTSVLFMISASLLIAGTTGSGKSVCINTIILSLLYRHTPDKCKFILIDPKMLELSTYEGVPHLLCPVITEAKKAASVLGWVVKEMENRYKLMTKEGVRNIDGYNTKHRLPMPYIVVVVDEMSDLMLVAGKEIENYIQKLSQMARAAGVHIIMATQRPSVDVITGTIKANFPTRISFQVTSKIDSRTILGEQGAEQLLGKGDMLYMSSANKMIRIHAPFVSENEIEKVNNFLGIKEGVENSNYLLEGVKEKYILTIFEKRTNENDLPYFFKLMNHLNNSKIKCPQVLEDKANNLYNLIKNKPAVITTFLEGKSIRNIAPKHCSELGYNLAKFHLSSNELNITRENALGIKDLKNLVSSIKDLNGNKYEDLLKVINHEYDYLNKSMTLDLPSGIIHADLFPDNVFFIDDLSLIHI